MSRRNRTRDTDAISTYNPTVRPTQVLRASKPAIPVFSQSVKQPFKPIYQSDRRLYHPDGIFRPVAATRASARNIIEVPHVRVKTVTRIAPKSGKFVRVKIPVPVKSRVRSEQHLSPGHFQFQQPKRVSLCMRRRERREVLFALGRTGKGNRKPKWNYNSYISCGG